MISNLHATNAHRSGLISQLVIFDGPEFCVIFSNAPQIPDDCAGVKISAWRLAPLNAIACMRGRTARVQWRYLQPGTQEPCTLGKGQSTKTRVIN